MACCAACQNSAPSPAAVNPMTVAEATALLFSPLVRELESPDEAPESEESAAKAPVSEALYCCGLSTPGVWQPATVRQSPTPHPAAAFLSVFIGRPPV